MNALIEHLLDDERTFISASIFVAAFALSDLFTAVRILIAFVTVIIIPGSILSSCIFRDPDDRRNFSVPLGFGTLPMLAYLLGVFRIPFVSPLVPAIIAAASLLFICYKKQAYLNLIFKE